MLFHTMGEKGNPAVLFFHAMGVVGASSEPVAKELQDKYFCILPTSTVCCAGQRYISKEDEVKQTADFLASLGVEKLSLVVASSIGADLAMAFLTQSDIPAEHVFFDGGQFAQISSAGALALSLGIAIQNFPEGAIISLPLRSEWMSKSRAFRNGVLSGAVEPVGAVLTILAARFIIPALPYLLSFAAGAMLYVVVEELIREMSQGTHSNIGTIFFAVGFSVMMVLDMALG